MSESRPAGRPGKGACAAGTFCGRRPRNRSGVTPPPSRPRFRTLPASSSPRADSQPAGTKSYNGADWNSRHNPKRERFPHHPADAASASPYSGSKTAAPIRPYAGEGRSMRRIRYTGPGAAANPAIDGRNRRAPAGSASRFPLSRTALKSILRRWRRSEVRFRTCR